MLDLDAGKYAMFVWPAYGVSALAFIGMIAMSLSFSRRWRKRAEELKASAPERASEE
jgi:heme exporter protein D